MVRRKNSPLYDSFLLCRNSIRKDLSHIAHKRRNARFNGLWWVNTPPQPLNAHTAACTPKQGPSFPRPQRGFALPVKSILFRHAFIYIHFPVHCEPSTPAEEKNLSKLLSQTLSQTIFHRVFQLLPQTAHVRFHSRKRVHTLAFANRIAHNGTHSETGGVSDGGAIITLDTSCTFTNIPGPGIRPAYFAAFGS